jgi:hypothetical protein
MDANQSGDIYPKDTVCPEEREDLNDTICSQEVEADWFSVPGNWGMKGW